MAGWRETLTWNKGYLLRQLELLRQRLALMLTSGQAGSAQATISVMGPLSQAAAGTKAEPSTICPPPLHSTPTGGPQSRLQGRRRRTQPPAAWHIVRCSFRRGGRRHMLLPFTPRWNGRKQSTKRKDWENMGVGLIKRKWKGMRWRELWWSYWTCWRHWTVTVICSSRVGTSKIMMPATRI